ncbi:hypothetical protein [Streptomyces sp. NPDC056361]
MESSDLQQFAEFLGLQEFPDLQEFTDAVLRARRRPVAAVGGRR